MSDTPVSPTTVLDAVHQMRGSGLVLRSVIQGCGLAFWHLGETL